MKNKINMVKLWSIMQIKYIKFLLHKTYINRLDAKEAVDNYYNSL